METFSIEPRDLDVVIIEETQTHMRINEEQLSSMTKSDNHSHFQVPVSPYDSSAPNDGHAA
jgi:hypothetical protein